MSNVDGKRELRLLFYHRRTFVEVRNFYGRCFIKLSFAVGFIQR